MITRNYLYQYNGYNLTGRFDASASTGSTSGVTTFRVYNTDNNGIFNEDLFDSFYKYVQIEGSLPLTVQSTADSSVDADYSITTIVTGATFTIFTVSFISESGTTGIWSTLDQYRFEFSPSSAEEYEFESCCDSTKIILTGYTGNNNNFIYPIPGKTYYIQTDCFSGCTTAVTPTGIGTRCGWSTTNPNGNPVEYESCAPCLGENPCGATPTPTVTPSQTPPCECYYQDLDININDINNSTGNSIYDDNTVYVRYIVCGGGIRIDKYTTAGTYSNAICVTNGEQANTQLYFYNTDTQFPAESTYSDTSNCCSAPPTPTPTATANVTPTPTSSITPTPTTSLTPTNTPSETPSVTPTNTPSETPSVTPTNTPSETPSVTPTNTPSGTPSVTPTPTSSPGSTPAVTPTQTNTPSGTPSVTPTNTPSETPSVTPTNTPSGTPSVTPTNTPSGTPSVTPTPTNTPSSVPVSPCAAEYCVDINIDAYSGYNGTYYYYQPYNGKPSWTGGTLPGYIFYKSGSTLSTNWCLSDSYSGDCIGSGPISPFCDDECPDFDPTIVLSGSCSPAPVDPCSSITIDADFYCNYTPGTTPLPTPSITPTTSPTPTPTDSTCAGFSASVSVIESTPQPTPTPTQTPTPTFARTVNTGGTVNFVIDSGDFVCFDVKELSDCDSGILYYISGNLKYNGLTISTGTTIQAYLNNEVKCLTYQRDVNGSATAYLGQITNTGTTCSICAITPTPSMTSSLTPTPTLTPSPTPNPTVAPTTNFVFQSCVENKLVVQTQQPGSLTTGRIVKINNVCYTYLGSFTNYIPPVGYQVVNNNFITSTPATQYDTCTSCSTPPTVYYQVIKQTTNCQNTGSAVYVTKPSTVSTPSVGQYVKLSNFGGGYGGCWKVIGTSSSGPASTSIIDVHNQCDCSD